MTTKVKISRKELKRPDEFITLTARFLQWIEDYRVAILAAVAGAAAVALVVAGVTSFLGYREDRARDAMAAALADYRAPEEAAAPTEEDGAPRGMTPARAAESFAAAGAKFDDVHAKYASSDAGTLSLLYAGDAYFRAGDYPRAVASYEAFLAARPDDPMLSPLAAEGLGYAYENQKEYAKAAAAFEKTTGPTAKIARPFGLLNAARCLAAAGDAAKAISLYEQFLQDYPDSTLKAGAAESLAALKAGVRPEAGS